MILSDVCYMKMVVEIVEKGCTNL